MIKFEYENDKEEKLLSLNSVDMEQFFIDEDGDFCQKCNSSSYVVIALKNGSPYSDKIQVGCDTLVVYKILPRVTKITWE